MTKLVEFITRTKLSRRDQESGRWVADTFERGSRHELDEERAALAIGNGWAREVSADD